MSHFYGIDSSGMDYARPSRISPIHDRGFGISSRSNPRTDPMTRHHGDQTRQNAIPTHSNNGGGPPRRRIPVACARCRKRKIRCSGDPGDNTGCTNCKSAQMERGSCVFLRVQSFQGGMSPYSSSSPTLSTPAASSRSLGINLPHASLSTPTLNSTLAPQSSLRLGAFGMSSGLDSNLCDPASSMTMASRGFYDIGHEIPGQGDSTGYSYILSGGHSGHGIPDAGSGVLPSQHGDYPSRHWSTSKTTNGASTYFMEPDTSSGIGNMSLSSSASHMMPANSIFSSASMQTLSSSLPESGPRPPPLTDKILPPLPPRTQPSDFTSISAKSSYGYSDSSTVSSSSRSSSTLHRSPTGSYVPSSPMQTSSASQRSTPTLVPSSSASTSYSSSVVSLGTYNSIIDGGVGYTTPLGAPVEQLPLQRSQRADTSALQFQGAPRSSSHIPALPLRTSSSSSAGSNYPQTTNDQQLISKVY